MRFLLPAVVLLACVPAAGSTAVAVDRQVVIVKARHGHVSTVAAEARRLGGRIETRLGNLVQVSVPASALPALSVSPGVSSVRPPLLHVAAEVTGQEVSSSGVDRLHSSGVTGAGVKIAVIDVDFKGYGDAMKSGELPPDTNVKNFSCALRDTTAHGTAVAELVHDVAPGASLDLLCIDSELSLAKAVDWVINEHDIHVISHSITWLGGGRGDGVNYIGLSPDATAAKAFGAGILWVNAAGNYAQSHWSGAFSHRGSSVFQDFGGGDTGNQFSIPAKTTGCANLTWDDWPVSDQDFDLYVSQVGTGTVLASSRNIQRPGELGTPAEEACYKNTSASTVFAYASIQSLPPATTSRFDLFVTTGTLEHSVPQGSVAEPAESPFVLGVGAVCWLGNGIRPYSSQGPTIDGRIKPDLVAYDGVSTSTFGLSSNCNGGFLGTSAATPEVAGAAALLLQQQPGLAGQPGQLMAALEGRTAHLGLSGRNNLFGSGRLCFSACAPPPPPPPPPGPPPPPPPPPPSQAQLKLVLVRFATTPVRSKAGKPFAAAIAVARKDTGARVRTGKVLCSARLGGRSRVHLVRAGFRGGLARCSWRIPAGSRHKLLRGSVGLSYHGATIRRSFTRRIT